MILNYRIHGTLLYYTLYYTIEYMALLYRKDGTTLYNTWHYTIEYVAIHYRIHGIIFAQLSQAPAPARLSSALFPNYAATRPGRPGATRQE